MLCRINKENAKSIDKFISNYQTTTFLLSIKEEISLYLKLENNILHTKITLLNDFFDSLFIKTQRTLSIPKTNFFFFDMEYLEIEATEVEISFFWKLKDCERKRSFCLIEKEPSFVEFQMKKSFFFESFVLQEILKQFSCNEMGMSFSDVVSFYNGEAPFGSCVNIKNESGISNVNLCFIRKSIKHIIDKVIVNCEFLIDDENCKMAVNYEIDFLLFNHIMPIYLEKQNNSLSHSKSDTSFL